MQARGAVFSQRREEAKSDAELVEEFFSRLGHIGRVGFEFAPGNHRELPPWHLLFLAVFVAT
jgi:hypothetical protein